jgi:hypothetical protein
MRVRFEIETRVWLTVPVGGGQCPVACVVRQSAWLQTVCGGASGESVSPCMNVDMAQS